MPLEDTDRNFGFLLHEAARLFRQDFNRRAEQLGMTQVQCRALARLARNQGINQVALAEILEIQPMTLVRLIDRLAASGLVERRPDPKDRRAQLLFLTDAATPVLDQIGEMAVLTREVALAGFSKAERKQLLGALVAVKSNLGNP